MSEAVSVSAGIAKRYATAIFDLALGEKALDALEADMETLAAALNESADFAAFIRSPVYSREEQLNAITAIGRKLGLSNNTVNLLGLMATKRRLFVLPQLVAAVRALIAHEKGEITAEVTTAKPLTKGQAATLAAALKENVGREVKIHTTVDESIIGGLIVKVGSKMIDTSIRSKLAALQNTMKEVG